MIRNIISVSYTHLDVYKRQDKKVCKHMYSIRAGNLKFLESHNVKYFEIKFRQRMNTHDPVHFYMEDQSASINAINKYLK